VDVACFWIHETQILHTLGERSLLRELALSQDSVLLSSTQPADLGQTRKQAKGGRLIDATVMVYFITTLRGVPPALSGNFMDGRKEK
jgi:hypothetical protein